MESQVVQPDTVRGQNAKQPPLPILGNIQLKKKTNSKYNVNQNKAQIIESDIQHIRQRSKVQEYTINSYESENQVSTDITSTQINYMFIYR